MAKLRATVVRARNDPLNDSALQPGQQRAGPMSPGALMQMARDLNERSRPYALVTVVRAIAPTSAYVGAQAIVLADGTLHGWIGGGCAQGVVAAAAQAAMEAGAPKLVRISSDLLQNADDIEQHAMACASGGTIELFIQPYSVGTALCVLGGTPTAEEAMFFAARLGIKLVETPAQASVVLIATQGRGDEEALEGALRSGASQVLMIASRRKAKKMRELMSERGISEVQLARLISPVAKETGAQTPAEIALVSVAVVLGLLRHPPTEQSSGEPAEQPQAEVAPVSEDASRTTDQSESSSKFVNPVCGVEISTAHPKYIESYEGVDYYFCCDGCRATFLADPAKYAAIYHARERS